VVFVSSAAPAVSERARSVATRTRASTRRMLSSSGDLRSGGRRRGS
jgi:hypothetical protein